MAQCSGKLYTRNDRESYILSNHEDRVLASTLPSPTQTQATKGQAPLEGADGTIDDLKLALLENLENRGVLRKLKAQVSMQSTAWIRVRPGMPILYFAVAAAELSPPCMGS